MVSTRSTLGLVPVPEEGHQAVQVQAAALGHPGQQLPYRADAGQPLDEQHRELPGENRTGVGCERLRVAGTVRLVGWRLLMAERWPDIRKRDELDRGRLCAGWAAGRQGRLCKH